MRRLLFLLIFLPLTLHGESFWQGSAEGGFTAEISFSAPQLSIEEELKIEALLSYPDAYAVDREKLRINLLKYAGLSEPPFALIDEKSEILPNGKHKITFTLSPQLAGLQFLSLYDISFLPKDLEQHKPVEIVSDIFKVTITLPPLKEEYLGMESPLLSLIQQFPISIDPGNRKNLLGTPSIDAQEAQRNEITLRQKSLPWAELIGALFIAVVMLIVRMQPPKKPDIEKERRKRTLSAKNKALRELDALEKRGFAQAGEYNPYYAGLTDTVRKYIEERFQLKATTRTTQEFLREMAAHPSFDLDTRSALSDFLVNSDKVKFADHRPTAEEYRQARETAKQFILKNIIAHEKYPRSFDP